MVPAVMAARVLWKESSSRADQDVFKFCIFPVGCDEILHGRYILFGVLKKTVSTLLLSNCVRRDSVVTKKMTIWSLAAGCLEVGALCFML